MKRTLFFLLLIVSTVTGCGNGIVTRYATYGDALAAAAMDKGWIPEFVPTDAFDIIESHDVDANHIRVEFSTTNRNLLVMLKTFRPLGKEESSAAIRELAVPEWSELAISPETTAFSRCGEVGAGIALVDPARSRVHYVEPIKRGCK